MAREDGFFDDLARGLADGSITRGKALRLMGAAVVGGALGSLGIGAEASADPPGCKRNGKTCTRNTQCCSGNCSSGTCQAQTTTTTTTSTTTSTTSTSTSTTTPTTSTSTSTTSTSTTPMCFPDDSLNRCTTDTQCCGGNCSLGFCLPRNRINCGCQTCTISTCGSAVCSDATAVNQFCADQCAQNGCGGLTGTPECIPEGCVS
jgi:hypothetical protein